VDIPDSRHAADDPLAVHLQDILEDAVRGGVRWAEVERRQLVLELVADLQRSPRACCREQRQRLLRRLNKAVGVLRAGRATDEVFHFQSFWFPITSSCFLCQRQGTSNEKSRNPNVRFSDQRKNRFCLRASDLRGGTRGASGGTPCPLRSESESNLDAR
jgi:hypothetical protein